LRDLDCALKAAFGFYPARIISHEKADALQPVHFRFVAIEDGCSPSPPSIVACVTLSKMHSMIANAPSAMSAVCIERFKRWWSDHGSTAALAALYTCGLNQRRKLLGYYSEPRP
jgi:hypothetical protein